MSDVVKQILEWIERVVPGLLAAFGLGYKVGQGEKAQLEKKIAEVELELKLKANHEKVDRDNSTTSDVDGVNKIAGGRD